MFLRPNARVDRISAFVLGRCRGLARLPPKSILFEGDLGEVARFGKQPRRHLPVNFNSLAAPARPRALEINTNQLHGYPFKVRVRSIGQIVHDIRAARQFVIAFELF
jgi:hypothetical protein